VTSSLRPAHRHLPVPVFLKPVLRFLFDLHYLFLSLWRRLVIFLYKEPLLRSQAVEAGKNLRIDGLPEITGNVELHIGDGVMFSGPVRIRGANGALKGRLVLKNGSALGGNSEVTVKREIVLEEHVIISTDCWISDAEAYPGPDARPGPEPVHIGRYAWVGNHARIFKGVRIGEGAIIGANSVVASDIPAYCLAMGNPAEVFFRNVGRPKRKNPPAGN
jgi:acetyltransferase-like isoleucine patch superfamily enzyme